MSVCIESEPVDVHVPIKFPFGIISIAANQRAQLCLAGEEPAVMERMQMLSRQQPAVH